MHEPEDNEPAEFASPACYLHELTPELAGTAPAKGRPLSSKIASWRKAERDRLIKLRLELNAERRTAMDEIIANQVETLIGDPEGKIVSAYWPFKCEPDLKPLLRRLAEKGARTALPVVQGKARPLMFRAWRSGDALDRGVWKIPFPCEGDEVLPDIVIAPVVGFDWQCFRLGYGGGFFDRTLAAMPRLPRRIGVGYSFQKIETIHPHGYDIPMEAVVTEDETFLPS